MPRPGIDAPDVDHELAELVRAEHVSPNADDRQVWGNAVELTQQLRPSPMAWARWPQPTRALVSGAALSALGGTIRIGYKLGAGRGNAVVEQDYVLAAGVWLVLPALEWAASEIVVNAQLVVGAQASVFIGLAASTREPADGSGTWFRQALAEHDERLREYMERAIRALRGGR